MREDFPVRSLGEICDILDSKRKPITKRNRVAGPYPYYGATGVLDYVEDYIFDEALVLIGEDGAKWGAGEGTAYAVEGKCWVNNHAHVIRPHREVTLDSWIIYYMNAADLAPFISGLTVPKLNQARLREIPIPLPALPEQKRIVAILDEAFAGIATAVANTEKNLANARELFESYLSTTLSRQGEGCATRTLDELCSIARGGSPRPIRAFLTNDPGGINWIKISDATASSKYIYETKQKINPEGVKRSRMVNEGDLLLSNSMSFGRPYIMKTSGCIHDGWLVLSDKSGLYEKEYLYHYLGSSDAYRQFDSRASGSTVRNLNIDLVRTVSVPLPSLDTQREIVEALEDFAAECDRLESIYQQKLGAFGELKQSLLQKAFCGELTAGKVGASQPHEETSVA